MKTTTFKTILKENKEVLKGRELTIYVGTGDWPETFSTLEGFGKRILELEGFGYTFSFEDSLTKVRAIYNGHIHVPTLEEMTNEIKRFGTAA